jgi:hypothetical protein
MNKAQANGLACLVLAMVGSSLVTHGAANHGTGTIILGAFFVMISAVWSYDMHCEPPKTDSK